MSFNMPPPGSGNAGVSTQPDVFVNGLKQDDTLVWTEAYMKWTNKPLAGGADGAYALGRVLYDEGWPSARPANYAYIDWMKATPADPNPPSHIMVQGDTVS